MFTRRVDAIEHLCSNVLLHNVVLRASDPRETPKLPGQRVRSKLPSKAPGVALRVRQGSFNGKFVISDEIMGYTNATIFAWTPIGTPEVGAIAIVSCLRVYGGASRPQLFFQGRM